MENIIKHYENLKSRHTDAIVLIRHKDEYITIGEDAEKVSKCLDLPITIDFKREKNYTSFNYYELDTWLPKLVRAGHRVAICDLIS